MKRKNSRMWEEMICVPADRVKNSRSVMGNSMEKIGKKSVEKLHHFGCVHCKKWWTVGDAPENKKIWWCPWCRKENKYEKRTGKK
jgi:hypothetical protein